MWSFITLTLAIKIVDFGTMVEVIYKALHGGLGSGEKGVKNFREQGAWLLKRIKDTDNST